MGISNKCFEVLENRRSSDAWEARPESHLGMNGGSLEEDDGTPHSDVDEEDDDDDEADETPDEDADENGNAELDTESDEDDEDDDTDSEAGSSVSGRGRRTRLRLREILFYDDKVAVFKARHGRL